MVSDLTRMGEWSPESEGATWRRGATGPEVGAKFRGANRNGKKRWRTTGRIVESQPGSLFVFRTTAGGLPIAEWRYEFEATTGGCQVTETWIDRRGRIATALGKPVSGVADRADAQPRHDGADPGEPQGGGRTTFLTLDGLVGSRPDPVSYRDPMTPTIRRAQPVDVEPVLGLWLRSDAIPTRTDNAESLGALVRHDPSALLVAEDDGVIVGSIIAAWDGWRGSVYRLVVAPSHRRTGLGRRLVLEAEAGLAGRGAVRLQAVVIEGESGAMEFWRACGWEHQTEAARFVTG